MHMIFCSNFMDVITERKFGSKGPMGSMVTSVFMWPHLFPALMLVFFQFLVVFVYFKYKDQIIIILINTARSAI